MCVRRTHARLPKAIEREFAGRGDERASIVSEVPNDPQGKPTGFTECDTLSRLGFRPVFQTITG